MPIRPFDIPSLNSGMTSDRYGRLKVPKIEDRVGGEKAEWQRSGDDGIFHQGGPAIAAPPGQPNQEHDRNGGDRNRAEEKIGHSAAKPQRNPIAAARPGLSRLAGG